MKRLHSSQSCLVMCIMTSSLSHHSAFNSFTPLTFKILQILWENSIVLHLWRSTSPDKMITNGHGSLLGKYHSLRCLFPYDQPNPQKVHINNFGYEVYCYSPGSYLVWYNESQSYIMWYTNLYNMAGLHPMFYLLCSW